MSFVNGAVGVSTAAAGRFSDCGIQALAAKSKEEINAAYEALKQSE